MIIEIAVSTDKEIIEGKYLINYKKQVIYFYTVTGTLIKIDDNKMIEQKNSDFKVYPNLTMMLVPSVTVRIFTKIFYTFL